MKKKFSRMRLFIQIHLLVYALLLVIFGIRYIQEKNIEPALKATGLVPEEPQPERKARVVPAEPAGK